MPLRPRVMFSPDDEATEARRSDRQPYDCAFCGEANDVFVDGSGARVQKFTEDCEVCCRPNLLTISIERDGWVNIDVEREYDA